ncbi:MAG: hypothetical protein KJ052_02800 [Candidatus Hydrogenedentes bacterium]|nr:hypothetical protein [Candidatus Hydrogenedentota bacterium]
MGKAALGLMWEEWRRTRRALLLLLCGIILTGVLGLLFPLTMDITPQHILILLGLPAYLIFSASTSSDIRIGIPTRHYRLPVSTFSLILWPLVYRIAVVLFFGLLVIAERRFCFHDAKPDFAFMFVPAAVMAWAQMLAWTARFLGKWIASVLLFFSLFPGIFLVYTWVEGSPLSYPWSHVTLFLIMTSVALVAPTLCHRVLRSGGINLRQQRMESAGEASPAYALRALAAQPFASPFLAQCWFEWRALGKRMTFFLCAISCALVAFLSMVSSTETDSPHALGMAMTILAMICVCVGLRAFAVYNSGQRRQAAIFVYRLPVNDATLGWARLGSASRIVFWGVVFTAIASIMGRTLGLLFTSTPLNTPGALSPQPSEWPLVLWGIPLVLLLVWLGYFRGGFIMITYGLTICAVEFFVEFVSRSYILRIFSPEHDYMPGAGVLCMVYTAPFLLVFVRVYEKRLLPNPLLAFLGMVWVAATVLLVYVASHFPPIVDNLETTTVLWPVMATLTLLAISPVATAVHGVYRQRHA